MRNREIILKGCTIIGKYMLPIALREASKSQHKKNIILDWS